MPKVGLCAPGFDGKPAADTNEDNEQIGFEIRTGNDREGHESEDAQQQPIHVAPPGTIPIYIFEIFLGEWPPDINNEENGQQKPAKQNTAIAGPKMFDGGADLGHNADYIIPTVINCAFPILCDRAGYSREIRILKNYE